MMEQFDLVAMGGTFDVIHNGHMALLNKSFSISSKVIIGLSSDQLAAKRGKNLVSDYSKRLSCQFLERNQVFRMFKINQTQRLTFHLQRNFDKL